MTIRQMMFPIDLFCLASVTKGLFGMIPLTGRRTAGSLQTLIVPQNDRAISARPGTVRRVHGSHANGEPRSCLAEPDCLDIIRKR